MESTSGIAKLPGAVIPVDLTYCVLTSISSNKLQISWILVVYGAFLRALASRVEGVTEERQRQQSKAPRAYHVHHACLLKRSKGFFDRVEDTHVRGRRASYSGLTYQRVYTCIYCHTDPPPPISTHRHMFNTFRVYPSSP